MEKITAEIRELQLSNEKLRNCLRDKEEKIDAKNLQMRNTEKNNSQRQQRLEENCEKYLTKIQELKEGMGIFQNLIFGWYR